MTVEFPNNIWQIILTLTCKRIENVINIYLLSDEET